MQTQVTELTADNDQLTDTNTTLVRQLASTQEEVRQAKASLPTPEDLKKQRDIMGLVPRLEKDDKNLKSGLYTGAFLDRLERGKAFDKELFRKIIAISTTSTGRFKSSTTMGQLLKGLKENPDLAEYLEIQVDKKTKQKHLRAMLGTPNDNFKKLENRKDRLIFFSLSRIEEQHQASQHAIEATA
ncbi:hypothetical protein [Piscirickettsia salmonis]|uniref:hypothetical protein n=1 Tax=Piscirickettsia salmonis TaxID=1238 RepID=UPI001EE43894|nr:hypothetical protein [Piscirickettsia salmonis]